MKTGEAETFNHSSTEKMNTLAPLQQSGIATTMFALPHSEGYIALDTDTCKEQIGFVLMLHQPMEAMKPLGYWPWRSNEAKQNHDTTYREGSAVAWAILILRPYQEGQRFPVREGCDAHEWILNLPNWTGLLARWGIQLSEFHFEVIDRDGIRNQVVDAFSWLERERTDRTLLQHYVPKLMVFLVQHMDVPNDEEDGSSANKYCVCENWEVITSDPQEALTEVAAMESKW